jgi:6-phosphogluconolactonase
MSFFCFWGRDRSDRTDKTDRTNKTDRTYRSYRSYRAHTAVYAAAYTAYAATAAAEDGAVYFGTYTGPGKSEGVYVASFDSITGHLGSPKLAAKLDNPSYVALSSDGQNLYAVSEGEKESRVTAFRRDAATGMLTEMGSQSTKGSGACHVSLDLLGKTVMVANYGSGSVASYTREADGKISLANFYQHEGRSVNPKRQEGPHAHQILIAPDGQRAYVPDLGLDKILIYRVTGGGSLTPSEPSFVELKGGSGPRHLAFHPREPLVWVVNEMASSVTVLKLDPTTGGLSATQTQNALPADFSGSSSCAHIVCHPEGRWLYASNRGHDSIATFSISKGTGWLRAVGHTPVGGKTPRDFNLDPSGQWMVVANQSTDNVRVFKLNPETGLPEATDQEQTIGKPVCVAFVRPQ